VPSGIERDIDFSSV